MNIYPKFRRLTSVLLAVLMMAALTVPMTLPASAANRRFITELRVEAGENAVAALEEDGWSVMMVGLNVTPDPAAQVYLAFKQNTGAPITNVIVSPDVGDTLTDANGIVYNCVSHVDMDEGIEGSAGCLYATKDERAGAPLVGLDVIRGDSANGDVLYPITNDGAEIVRTPKGAPADLENAGTTGVVYLAQIRDGIVRPYISEIGVVTDTDKWNAVYTACERGYNYYVDGDIDDSAGTYTIIAYERTADPEKAITNVAAVSEQTVRSLEEAQVTDSPAESAERFTAAAISISGAQYIRVSSTPVSAEEPYYLYMTTDRAAGNPISMIYAETPEQTQNFLFGMWANSYFFSPGTTTAYTYCMNEDLYISLWEDKTVCTKIPVQYLDDYTRSAPIASVQENTPDDRAEITEPVKSEPTTPEQTPEVQQETPEQPAETQQETPEQSEETQPETPEQPAETQQETPEQSAETQQETPEQPPEIQPEVTEPAKPEADSADGNVKYINLTMLTPRDGLPASVGRITGMRDPVNINYVERTQRSDRVNKFQASVFSGKTGIALIAGGAVILGAAAFVIYKKRSGKKAPAAPQKSKKR